ncbi:12880_t:CDS:1, partial [Acaulospora colombiana]
TVFGESFDEIFGCSATEFHNFKNQSLLDMNSMEFGYLVFNSLDWILSGEIFMLTFSEVQWAKIKSLSDQSNSNEDSSIIASRIRPMVRLGLTVVDYIRNFNNSYEDKTKILDQKEDDGLSGEIDGESVEVLPENSHELTLEEIRESEERDLLSREKDSNELGVETSIRTSVNSEDHFDLDLFRNQNYLTSRETSRNWSREENFENLSGQDLILNSESSSFLSFNDVNLSFGNRPSFTRISYNSFDKHGDIFNENSSDYSYENSLNSVVGNIEKMSV